MTRQTKKKKDHVVLSIDIGGSHVKILSSTGGVKKKADSGKNMSAADMVAAVKTLAEGMSYDVTGARRGQ